MLPPSDITMTYATHAMVEGCARKMLRHIKYYDVQLGNFCSVSCGIFQVSMDDAKLRVVVLMLWRLRAQSLYLQLAIYVR